jgi:hypothetical protein
MSNDLVSEANQLSNENIRKSGELQRKYPTSYFLKFGHLLLFDMINVILSSANHYGNGIIIHSSVALLHFVILGVDFYLRTRNFKK